MSNTRAKIQLPERYTEIETITKDQIQEYMKKAKERKWSILKIEPWWDTKKMHRALVDEVNSVKFKVKDPEIYSEFYEGISIQKMGFETTQEHADYNSLNRTIGEGEPIYTSHGTFFFSRKGLSKTPSPDFTPVENPPKAVQEQWEELNRSTGVTMPHYLNHWANIWPDFLLSLAEVGLVCVRGRYLRANPDQQASVHSDEEVRLHFPIDTNDRCFFKFYGPGDTVYGHFNLPADGNAYLFNAYTPHAFGNYGITHRTHAVFGVHKSYNPYWEKFFPELKNFTDVLNDYKNSLMEHKAGRPKVNTPRNS